MVVGPTAKASLIDNRDYNLVGLNPPQCTLRTHYTFVLALVGVTVRMNNLRLPWHNNEPKGLIRIWYTTRGPFGDIFGVAS